MKMLVTLFFGLFVSVHAMSDNSGSGGVGAPSKQFSNDILLDGVLLSNGQSYLLLSSNASIELFDIETIVVSKNVVNQINSSSEEKTVYNLEQFGIEGEWHYIPTTIVE